MNKEDSSLVIETLRYLHSLRKNAEITELVKTLGKETANISRVRFYYTYALLRAGFVCEAEKEFMHDGGIDIDDIREGEEGITSLWFDLQEEVAKRDGKTFDRKNAKPPRRFDFRMNVLSE